MTQTPRGVLVWLEFSKLFLRGLQLEFFGLYTNLWRLVSRIKNREEGLEK